MLVAPIFFEPNVRGSWILKKNFPYSKIILTYHNDPQNLRGSINPEEREKLLDICTEIVFISNWIKKRFFTDLKNIKNNNKIIYHGIKKKNKINQKNKNFIYTGCQILNKSIFKSEKNDIFPINKIWFNLIKNKKLNGFESKLNFYHVTNLEIFKKLQDL